MSVSAMETHACDETHARYMMHVYAIHGYFNKIDFTGHQEAIPYANIEVNHFTIY